MHRNGYDHVHSMRLGKSLKTGLAVVTSAGGSRLLRKRRYCTG